MADPTTRLTAALADRYLIERELGQGGMATVYLAQDVRHDRKVALKVLRPELAAIIGAERFLSEIKTTANLQHPHILPLFDSGEVDGFLFYVMPFVEGETVRDRLTREKQLPVDEAVRIAKEVASALDYAHRRNIIHRDIKPENILLHDGAALVADFGIALAVSRSDGGTRMTETGMSLGTPHYMSPEQAMGEREITARSDVYALGCVLYEMLTGDPPFTGSTAQAIVARVVTEHPRPMLPQRHTIPPHVEAAVLTALEKLPADRFATAAEFLAALGNTAFGPRATASGAAPGQAGVAHGRPLPGRGAAVAIAVVATALAAWGWLRPGPERPVTRYGLAFAPGQEPRGGFAFTPDGSRLLYQGPGDTGGAQVWVKERSEYLATPIAGTAGGGIPVVSPDGEWFAKSQGGQIRKWPIRGGSAITLTGGASGAPVAWLADGTLVYSTSDWQLGRVPAAGGEATIVWQRPDSLSGSVALMPAELPGGRGVLFTLCRATCNTSDLWVVDFRSGGSKRLVPDAARSWYLPTGHLAYSRQDGSVLAVPFDLGSLEVSGAPVPILEGVTMSFTVFANLAFSQAGTLAMQAGGQGGTLNPLYELVSLDRRGGLERVDSTWTFSLSRVDNNPGWAVSPDGRRLAIGLSTDAGDDIWIKALPDGPLSRLTFDSTAEQRPRWTPDGKSVTYITRFPKTVLLQRRADGTGGTDSLLVMDALLDGRWTADGKWLVVRAGGAGGGLRNIFALRPGVDSVPREFLGSAQADESAPMVSPDGRWLAYVSDETGRDEIYIRPFPNVDDGKWQASVNGGQAPLWSHSGRELFYVDRDRNMVAVAVPAQGPSQLGARQVLFRLPEGAYLRDQEYYTPFDITPDDRRFIMARLVRAGSTEAASFIIVENWFDEVRAKLRGK
ncbi:MAG: serine/threonine-protein kinase [Gemmatimonadota bacterium]|nr:serine/threonine-protein kinase [Gemmatimonadota bacterium]